MGFQGSDGREKRSRKGGEKSRTKTSEGRNREDCAVQTGVRTKKQDREDAGKVGSRYKTSSVLSSDSRTFFLTFSHEARWDRD